MVGRLDFWAPFFVTLIHFCRLCRPNRITAPVRIFSFAHTLLLGVYRKAVIGDS
jgi:hypothetical protein